MVSSMTGFARRERSGDFGTLVCELRSVNHRFLDVGLRLPESCRAVEGDLRALLARELKRGKVDCTIYHRPATAAAGLEVDSAALERLLARARDLAAALAGPARINVLDVLRWPGVLREESTDADALAASVRALLGDTLSDLVRVRAREGERLAELIEQRCAGVLTWVQAVRTRLPEVHERIRARFQERLRELAAEVQPERVEQEVLLMLQRSEVAEELERLEGHVTEARHTLGGTEPAGRRLDFLMQEFNREANTLSSKSQDLETTRAAVEMKVLIEQMREQVQNIE
jgi:uncharacterized protein (TIGR00255 family)